VSVAIRLADADDVPQIIAMAQRFLRETDYSTIVGPVADETIGVLVRQVMQVGVVFVADVNLGRAQLVGFLAVMALMHPFAQVPYGDELAWWVEPEHRAGLVGPRLLRSCEEWARQKGLCVLKIVAPAGNSDVGKYLARRGFSEVETTFHKRL
jgi:GNAT superfamily N-acetyltransferase